MSAIKCHPIKCTACKQEFLSVASYWDGGTSWRLCDADHLWFECSCGATLTLYAGTHDWYTPKGLLRPASLPYYEDLERAKTLPLLPSALMNLQKSLRDPHASAAAMAKTLLSNGAIAREVLKWSKHLATDQQDIYSIEDLTKNFSKTTICLLTLVAVLQRLELKANKYSQQNFWQEALLNALLSKKLATQFVNPGHGEIGFLCGLFCNIGKLLGALCYPDYTDKIVDLVSNPKTMTTWIKSEQKFLAPSHVILGEIASVLWGLPETVRQVIFSHHAVIQRNPQENRRLRLGECVGFACLLGHWVQLMPYRIDREQLVSFQLYLGLSEREVEKLVGASEPLKDTVRDHFTKNDIA